MKKVIDATGQGIIQKKNYWTIYFKTKNNKDNKLLTDGTEEDVNTEESKNNNEENPMESANKSMTYMMPLLSVSIALIAPLGLALYWLINNVLMIIERIVLSKVIKEEEV